MLSSSPDRWTANRATVSSFVSEVSLSIVSRPLLPQDLSYARYDLPLRVLELSGSRPCLLLLSEFTVRSLRLSSWQCTSFHRLRVHTNGPLDNVVIDKPANSSSTNLGCMSPFALVGHLLTSMLYNKHTVSSIMTCFLRFAPLTVSIGDTVGV